MVTPELHVHQWDPQYNALFSCGLDLSLSESVRLAVPPLQGLCSGSLIPHLLITKEIHEAGLNCLPWQAARTSVTMCNARTVNLIGEQLGILPSQEFLIDYQESQCEVLQIE